MTVSNILAFVVYPNVLQSFFGMTGASVENYDTNQYFAREAPSYQAALDRTAILGRMIEAEGAVLLKNDNNSLPLESGAKVSCLGVIAFNTLVFSPKRRKKLLDKGDIYEN